MIYLGQESKERISAYVLSAFPMGTSGFLFGMEDSDGNRTITDVLNKMDNNISVSQQDLKSAEEYGTKHELKLIGIYRSHIGNEAIPSGEENISDNPGFTYLLITVNESQIGSLRAWRFTDDNDFKEELISDKPLA